MIEILQRLIDLIVSWVTYLLPWCILGDDQVGLIRRLGVFDRVMRHGLNWKWPLIELPLTETSAYDSASLSEQTLTTADGKQITLRGVITYYVTNPKKYILGCDSPISIINDVGCCVIAEVVPLYVVSDIVLLNTEFKEMLLERMKKRAKKWGVNVESIGLVDCVQAKTFRLITSARTSGLPS